MADSLYIGKVFDPATRALGDPFKLDPGDFTTHGLIVGMTGSGKTGFAVDIIEELLQQNVPVIVVDPKGDMTNLALAFDRLDASQFEPWVDADEAAREGKAVAAVAAETAQSWQKGLADWGLGADRVATYAAGRRVRIFTPGASAGIPLNVVESLEPPDGDFEANEEEYRDEIDSIVQGLMGLVGVKAEPVTSREYILLFSLIERAWRAKEPLTLDSLVGAIHKPPMDRLGALPLETVYPEKDRVGLMLALNNLLASPPFEAWRTGEPIDIESWVRPAGGKPQVSIVFTAHLDDEQRMFVTTLVLNRLRAWMRRQSGTGELRALFYMDEIFGYFPPTANPPSKKPLLSLLKQARAYGVGVLLSTQNPVDLDYKGLANMGFWAIGRLQTTQDQARVREGIEAALSDSGSGLDFDRLIAGVQKRVFLVHDIHRKAPALVQSRWAMSYLRGPITREELPRLGEAVEWQPAAAPSAAASPAAASTGAPSERPRPAPAPEPEPLAPVVPTGLDVFYWGRDGGQFASPWVMVAAAVRYKAGGVALPEERRVLGFPVDDATPLASLLEADPVEFPAADELATVAPAGIRYPDLPQSLRVADARPIERVLRDRLDDRLATTALYDPVTKTFGHPGEDETTFAARLQANLKTTTKRDALEQRLAKKRADLGIRQEETRGRRFEKWASIGTSILSNLSIFTGKKRNVTGLGTVLSKNRMEGTSERRAQQLQQEVAELEAELADLGDVDPRRLEWRELKPAKTDVSILRYGLVWVY